MTTHKEALKLALEALEWFTAAEQGDEPPISKAITAIKEALAQPEQEPVAIYQYKMGDGSWIDQEKHSYDYNKRYAPNATVRVVYTTPPQRKPLTLGQKQRLWSSLGNKPTLKDRVNAFGLAIEAAHGIKE